MAENLHPSATHPPRSVLLRRGLLLVALTVAWMLVEAGVSLAAGAAARSVALLGFGVDSLIELGSAAVVGWRLRAEQQAATDHGMEWVERQAARLTGSLLLLLALYLLIDAGRLLLGFGPPAEESAAGIAVTAAALVVMPLLARAKLRVAAGLGSRALRADAMEAVCCAWLSATTLLGLVVNAAFHWRWADPAAALLLVPLLAREGLAGWRGGCSDCSCGH